MVKYLRITQRKLSLCPKRLGICFDGVYSIFYYSGDEWDASGFLFYHAKGIPPPFSTASVLEGDETRRLTGRQAASGWVWRGPLAKASQFFLCTTTTFHCTRTSMGGAGGWILGQLQWKKRTKKKKKCWGAWESHLPKAGGGRKPGLESAATKRLQYNGWQRKPKLSLKPIHSHCTARKKTEIFGVPKDKGFHSMFICLKYRSLA